MSLADTAPPVPLRQDVMARWRMRSRLIRGLRLLLPAGLLGLVAIVGADSAWRAMNAATASVQQTAVRERALNPRITGLDSLGRRFEIIASEALRDETDSGKVEMRDVTILLRAGEAQETRVSARGGVYTEADGHVRLEGGVRIDDGRGNRFSAQRTLVDSRKGVISGTGGVVADGPGGAIRAGSYAGTRDDGTVVLKGGVSGRLNSR